MGRIAPNTIQVTSKISTCAASDSVERPFGSLILIVAHLPSAVGLGSCCSSDGEPALLRGSRARHQETSRASQGWPNIGEGFHCTPNRALIHICDDIMLYISLTGDQVEQWSDSGFIGDPLLLLHPLCVCQRRQSLRDLPSAGPYSPAEECRVPGVCVVCVCV